MPKPKNNIDYRAGGSATFLPIIHKFFKKYPPPVSWGKQKMPWHRAFFLAAISARPAFLNDGERLIGVRSNYDSFVSLFQTDPDYFAEFVLFFRKNMRVTSNIDMAKAFIREGAMQRFKETEGRDPTDDELSSMIDREHGVKVPTETFGDARRRAKMEDEEIEQIWRTLSDYDADWI